MADSPAISTTEPVTDQRLFAHGDLSVWKEQPATNTLLANDTLRNLVVEEW
jgi:hypothetical protein